MSSTFCALPWVHLLITSYGGGQVCCLARDMLRENGQHVSLYTSTLDEVWNCESLRRIRLNMLAGKPSPECSLCYQNEADNIRSERLEETRYWQEQTGFTIETARDATDAEGRTSIARPVYYQLLVSNACNLACRMCNAEASSRIEHDAVHRAWAPGYNNGVMPRWKGDRVSIGPEHHIGVAAGGLAPRQDDRGTNAHAILREAWFDVPHLPSTDPITSIGLSFDAQDGKPFACTITANSATLFDGTVEPGQSSLLLATDRLQPFSTLRLSIAVAETEGHQPTVFLREVFLQRAEERQRSGEYVVSRFSDRSKPLFDQDSFLFGELLARSSELRRVYVTGGEPLYSKSLLRMVAYLNDLGHSRNIDAYFTTNATVLSDSLLEQLRSFNIVRIGISLDALGDKIEYIRHGTKWQIMLANIERLRSVDAVRLHAIPAAQIMNILEMAETMRFCDSIDLPFGINLVYYPEFLNVLAAPRLVRDIAADRLEIYANTDCRPEQRHTVVSLVNHLRSENDLCTPERLLQFMLFTNDLDASRGESFKDAFPELHRLLEESGHTWTSNLKIATRDKGEKQGAP